MKDTIEINIEDKRFSISLAPLSEYARKEIREFFNTNGEQKRVKLVELLQAYVMKTQEHAQLYYKIERLYNDIETTTHKPAQVDVLN
ncbi:MAG: hypothetical protein PUJ79_06855 [Helicobacter sp.]|uniref:hypothetical protein n=1 Tax=Helicobacter sp. 10-6591 TaxID=2004998 RepID=UPI000DCDDB48|nr:hypothetical protein [Helicobacter sp. 10-6591]MCI7484889.1 hypothetical protein [Helicobacter sp.]MDD7568105.1 hypothetical protein [Helicobacter sp.]MDY5741303.1 hypothetical protein [Helicobacter sp.]RAX56180.1 hypothetical protein CCY97_01235 [Helicobacter sp. 10-6591]